MTNDLMKEAIERLAKAEYTVARQEILLRIARQECSASMSGIEYMPHDFDAADDFSKSPYMKAAASALAILEKGQAGPPGCAAAKDAEIARLREAIAPMVAAAGELESFHYDDEAIDECYDACGKITCGDLRKAALATTGRE
ncbi:hypothetical protein VH570_14440 [Sphingobium sp. HT1-2]|uniref:hypothetical protein n=1 Tax=Sphingobium sp. HT1-2 TaxID=3111640 RepID=UPI003C0D2A4C